MGTPARLDRHEPLAVGATVRRSPHRPAKRTQCVERALPANAQAEKDLRKAEDILANVVDCIRGRITHRDPRDKREQLLWFASELKRAAEEIGALLEERW